MPDDGTDDWYGRNSATFGDRVAAARDNAGMSRSQLARRLGVRKATLAAWEDDHAEPRANKLSMLAGLLNVSMSWLLTGEGEGMSAPTEAEMPHGLEDLADILRDLRSLRAEMRDHAERAGKMEKKLRRLVELASE